MKETEKPEPYEYSFEGGRFNSCIFLTKDDVRYEITFVSSTDYFDSYAGIDVEVYEMVISVIEKPMPGRLPADPRTAPTILTIFEEFYLPNRHALIFICDSSDNRERARFRKFGLWFEQRARTRDLAKIDRIIYDGDTVIMLALIISRLHPQRNQIVDVFMDLGTEEK